MHAGGSLPQGFNVLERKALSALLWLEGVAAPCEGGGWWMRMLCR
jgi:hypothetical protein